MSAAPRTGEPVIEIRDLEIAFGDRVVASVPELDLCRGQVVGLAGESGSGKSMTAMALLGLAGHSGASVRGSIRLGDTELVGLGERELRSIRGRRIALVMQSPRGALSPTQRLGQLFDRALRKHGVEAAERQQRIRAAVAEVRLEPDVLQRYPHEISGGQAQRFAIALAVALRAEVLVADEPTSALDVTVQAEVVELLRRVRDEHGTAILFISHDLAVIGQLAERVVVMRAGAVVESGPARTVLSAPTQEYTRELVAAVPAIGRDRATSAASDGVA
jgi:peptide/nickel transport system ATP-binding protein